MLLKAWRKCQLGSACHHLRSPRRWECPQMSSRTCRALQFQRLPMNCLISKSATLQMNCLISKSATLQYLAVEIEHIRTSWWSQAWATECCLMDKMQSWQSSYRQTLWSPSQLLAWCPPASCWSRTLHEAWQPHMLHVLSGASSETTWSPKSLQWCMCKEVMSFFPASKLHCRQHQHLACAEKWSPQLYPAFMKDVYRCVLKKLCSQASEHAALKISTPEQEGHGHDEEKQLIEQSLDLFVELLNCCQPIAHATSVNVCNSFRTLILPHFSLQSNTNLMLHLKWGCTQFQL